MKDDTETAEFSSDRCSRRAKHRINAIAKKMIEGEEGAIITENPEMGYPKKVGM